MFSTQARTSAKVPYHKGLSGTPRTGPVEIAPGVHWIGALDPTLRTFDIILSTANGTTFYMSAYGSTARMAEAVCAGAEERGGVRVSLYDLEGGEIEPFVDLIEEADGLVLGSPTINGDAVKPIWDLLSSLAVVNLEGKVGAAFGSYGWSGEAVRMIEDRMRGLEMQIPVKGLRVKLIPTADELEECRAFGRQLAGALLGEKRDAGVIEFADLA
jgi:flavorubredoxin